MSRKIFVSYRRDDERGIVGRLLSALQLSFTPEQLLADADPVEPGGDIVRTLNAKIGQSRVLVAIIGSKWLSASDTPGPTRLDAPADVVRVAIEAAFRTRTPVIPVLINDARMPTAEQLPASLRPLALLAPVRIQSDSFQADAAALVEALKRSVGPRRSASLVWAAVGIGALWIAAGLVFAYFYFGSSPPQTAEHVAPASPSSTAPSTVPLTVPSASQPASTVAERVVLYDEDPTDPKGRQYVGRAVWRTDQIAARNGEPSDVAVRADIEIPDRNVKLAFVLRRNRDSSLPASHTVELMFTLPPDFAGGGIDNVPGLLMKTNEQARGAPFAGRTVKVTDNFFLVGLSNVDADRARNIQMLKERSWFDIPMICANKRRAILAMDKGAQGERVVNEALAAWGQ